MSLPNTHAHVLRSHINGETYSLAVAFPADYSSERKRNTRYRTLYVLDGSGELPIFRSMIGPFGFEPATDIIVVGVDRAARALQKRSRDFTPPTPDSVLANTRDGDGTLRYGGAALFLRVIKEEIIPFIERTYRTNADRGIHGHSLGGLFVAYTMFEAPDLFNRYALTSPSLGWGKDMILKQEPSFAKQHPTFAKHVFLSVGSAEDPGMVRVAWQFAWQLCASFSRGSYRGLDLIAESIAGESHESYVHHIHAMRALYPTDSTQPKPRGVMRYCEP